MKRREFIKTCATSTALLTISPLFSRAAASAMSGANAQNTIRVIKLEGAPYERGLQHGRAAKDAIHSILALWDAMLQQQAGMDLTAFAKLFAESTEFSTAIRKYTPDSWAELQGIADGAEISFEKLYAYNLTDEGQWFLRYLGLGLPLPEGGGCSSLAMIDAATGLPVIAQNLDIPSGTEGFEVLLKILDRNKNLLQYVFTVVGMVGIIGLNSAPLGVCNNALSTLNQRKDGLPVNFVVRGLLDKTSFEEAKDFLYKVPHASGQNYVLAGAEAIGMYECSAGGVVEVTPKGDRRQLFHTNHPLVSKDINPNPAFSDPAQAANTEERLRSIKEHLGESEGKYFLSMIKEALSAHDDPQKPVCRSHNANDPGESFTAASVIYELSRPPVMHLAPGPPCKTPFVTFKLG